MPLARRLPKFGFSSRRGRFVDEVRLHQLCGLDADVVDLAVLKEAGLVSRRARRVKVIAAGTLTRAVILREVFPTRGAKAAVEAAGGRVE
jgi:large subunit ribosomal protein L15